MNGSTSLLRLMSWLSPVFPTGGYAYSAALEQAVADGTVSGTDELKAWIEALLTRGPQWNDAVFFAAAWNAAEGSGDVAEIAELARASASSFERHRETVDQGAGFLDAAANWFEDGALPPRGTPLCVA
ncbi:MAG: urease accessory UreF family protein, partial [Oricola sp.]